MSKSIRNLLLLAMCSLPVTSLVAADTVASGKGASQPPYASLSGCMFLQNPKLVGPESCQYISAVDSIFAKYAPPQPFFNKDLQTYTAGGDAASSPSGPAVPLGVSSPGPVDPAAALREQQAGEQSIDNGGFQ